MVKFYWCFTEGIPILVGRTFKRIFFRRREVVSCVSMNFVYWYCLFLLGPFFPLIELSLAQWGEKWVVSKEMKRGKFNGLTRKILMVIDVSIVTKKGKNWTTAKSRDKFTIEIYSLQDNWTLKRKIQHLLNTHFSLFFYLFCWWPIHPKIHAVNWTEVVDY